MSDMFSMGFLGASPANEQAHSQEVARTTSIVLSSQESELLASNRFGVRPSGNTLPRENCDWYSKKMPLAEKATKNALCPIDCSFPRQSAVSPCVPRIST